jgi:DNA-binding FrmR family transcriptional regulator
MPENASLTTIDEDLELAAEDNSAPSHRTEGAGNRIRSLNRLRRIEGQVRGLQRMLAENRPCGDVLTQISSVQEALRAAGRELLRDHLKQATDTAFRQGEGAAAAMCDEIVETVFRHAR